MHYEILDKNRTAVLEKLCKNINMDRFYMAGGTALSLQLGLRVSEDFDFFSLSPFNADSLYGELQKVFGKDINAVSLADGTCDITVNGVKLSFFHYPYELINDCVNVQEERFKGLMLAHTEDIAAMKMSAIGNRGSKKDFYDLYWLMNKTDLSAEKLLADLKEKFGDEFDLTYMIYGLEYFDDAEKERLPHVFEKCRWEDICDFCTDLNQEMLELYYEMEEPAR